MSISWGLKPAAGLWFVPLTIRFCYQNLHKLGLRGVRSSRREDTPRVVLHGGRSSAACC